MLHAAPTISLVIDIIEAGDRLCNRCSVRAPLEALRVRDGCSKFRLRYAFKNDEPTPYLEMLLCADCHVAWDEYRHGQGWQVGGSGRNQHYQGRQARTTALSKMRQSITV